MNSSLNFQPGQIVGLNHLNRCLYAEVIQVVEFRGVCWVRPLMLIERLADQDQGDYLDVPNTPESFILYNLQQSPDLIWPTQLFRAALDTEVIPFLAQLDAPDVNFPGIKPVNARSAHQQLREFIRQVWQAYPDVFQSVDHPEVDVK
ncbi:hypothetical protein PCC9214_02502 [Planktothrix tepida]|uniref:Uncharacterized protein n=2 Tax=Planktothrix TaxID=54304 RepID=A0A1J1LKU9_9CYAN|nr:MULTISPECIES: hypothetical protein [Planktothrix]CAD5950166.1 hypothetical protein PCC9214_02502 [Planktothrix tepida]CAD5960591.1 hypothetical protein NO713_03171 [Planktothrix pseudagardhii]CUR32548.1 conserved hypothetical protein [Planktothrix tepida PCC 9214]